MARKFLNIGSTELDALGILANEQGKSLQDLIDEAVVDLLKKHKRPTTTREMFRQSLGRKRQNPTPRPKRSARAKA
jgi:hypothetical protein